MVGRQRDRQNPSNPNALQNGSGQAPADASQIRKRHGVPGQCRARQLVHVSSGPDCGRMIKFQVPDSQSEDELLMVTSPKEGMSP
jgi:hypothetical protein